MIIAINISLKRRLPPSLPCACIVHVVNDSDEMWMQERKHLWFSYELTLSEIWPLAMFFPQKDEHHSLTNTVKPLLSATSLRQTPLFKHLFLQVPTYILLYTTSVRQTPFYSRHAPAIFSTKSPAKNLFHAGSNLTVKEKRSRLALVRCVESDDYIIIPAGMLHWDTFILIRSICFLTVMKLQ